MASSAEAAVIKAAFRSADLDKTGAISKQELATLLRHLDKSKWTQAAVNAVMDTMDSNKDQQIQYEEFLDWCLGGSSEANELLTLTRLTQCEKVTEEIRQQAIAFLCHKTRCALFPDISETLRSDEELVLRVMKDWDVPLKYGSESIRSNKTVVTTLVEKQVRNFRYASESLREDEELVCMAIRKHLLYPWCMEDIFDHVTSKITSSLDVMLEAVKIQPVALRFASPELQENKDLMLAAVNSPKCSRFSDALGKDFTLWFPRDLFDNDLDVMTIVVKKMPLLLKKASLNLRNDRDLVIAAVERDADALEYASESLRGDRSVVLKALQRSARKGGGNVLQFASAELQEDAELQAFQDEAYEQARRRAEGLVTEDETLVPLLGGTMGGTMGTTFGMDATVGLGATAQLAALGASLDLGASVDLGQSMSGSIGWLG